MDGDMRELEGKVNDLSRSTQSPPTVNTIQTPADPTLQAYQQTAQTVMSVQDEMLDQLGSGVSRLHNQAMLINEESTLHVNLLHEMDEDVESATMGLRQEAKHAERIREQSSVCKLYMIIAGETVLLVFLIIMGFSH
jgi:hypothetical protein